MYRLIKFGSTSLEHYNQVETVGSGQLEGGYVRLAGGGAFDLYGTGRVLPGTTEIVKTLRIQAASAADLETKFFGLMALKGKRDRLWRRTVQGHYHWITARLVEIAALRSYQITPFKRIQDVELRFVAQDPCWSGLHHGGWTLDSGVLLDNAYALDSTAVATLNSETTYVSLFNNGNYPVSDIGIIIEPGSANITALTIYTDGVAPNEDPDTTHLVMDTLPANSTISIDCGSYEVTGVSGMLPLEGLYDQLQLGNLHNRATWLTLYPGETRVSIQRTGGGADSKISFFYSDGWA
jgi:hypothetical protein